MLCLQTCRGSKAVSNTRVCDRVLERFLEIPKAIYILTRLDRELQRLVDCARRLDSMSLSEHRSRLRNKCVVPSPETEEGSRMR